MNILLFSNEEVDWYNEGRGVSGLQRGTRGFSLTSTEILAKRTATYIYGGETAGSQRTFHSILR